ncbi:MAG: extracellular solute-binding protein [Spirochaetales bacterium]|nr:extracellular solute-binding protein [Spirochaetales bacterium]
MKKLLVLTVLLSVAFSAFGSGESDDKTSGEPVVVTYKAYDNVREDTPDYYLTAIGNYLLEEFNVKLWTWPSTESGYRQELVTDAATNSLPDIINIWVTPNNEEITVLQKAAREGLLAPLNDAINTDTPTLLGAINNKKNYPIYAQEYMNDPVYDGKLYFLPMWYDVGEKTPAGWTFYIRDDILAQLDIEVPIYMDDTEQFLDILRDIKALKPLDMNDNPAWPLGSVTYWNGLMATFTRLFEWGGNDGIDVDGSGNISHFIQTEYPWQQILFMRKLFTEGLMDPESITQTFQVGRPKIAQGKYAVMPAFAGGSINWIKPLIAERPEMTNSILGSFYTYEGKSGPLLANNLGMQTHFLTAFSSNADLDVIMPMVDFLATPTGNATLAYGLEGVHWDWDTKGNAVLREEFVEPYLSSDVPNVWKEEVGLSKISFMNTLLGKNVPSAKIFSGSIDANYPHNPGEVDERNRRINVAYKIDEGGMYTANKVGLGSLIDKYPRKDDVQQLLSITYIRDNLMFPAYLAESEEAARSLYENYLAAVRKAGIDAYIDYLQAIYDEDPDRYVTYESFGG